MLINCVAYEQGRRLADVPVAEIGSYLSRPGCFVWVALRDATPEEMAQMQAQFGLPDLAVEDALHGHQRPKTEEYGDDTLFTVVHTVELSPTDEPVIGEVNVFVGRNYVLSVRNRSRQPLLGVRARTEREPELLQLGPAFVLYAIVDSVVDRYFPLLDALEDELDAIEDQIFEPGMQARENVKRLYALKRRVTQLRHVVQPLLEAMDQLTGGRVPPGFSHTQDYFRDVVDHLTHIQGALENLRETISTAIQVNLAVSTIEESQTTKQLAAWAGVFALATFLVGVWGMNFKYMPELEQPWGYPAALAVIFGACGLVGWRFRRAGWL